MTIAAPLSTIIALARAGALDHAWGQFSAAGYDRENDDPAALTVKGRLLKDYALRASDDAERRRFYLQSAEAYRRSAALQPGTYPLINAATLSLLSGDRDQAGEIAGEVLERIAREPDEPETPYWRAATEAEALLLLGRTGEARTALAAAVAAAPRAWEDHASTLRQFLVIQDVLGGDAAWLDLLRPQRSLHYSAAPAADGGDPAAIAAILSEEDVGFGFGALAAGAEIVAAEALLAAGAALYIVLPSDSDSFAARFVNPYGGGWRARFDAALAAAEMVEHVRPLRTPPDARLAALAHEVALGAAMLNADRLMGEAIALRVGGGAAAPAGVRAHLLDGPAPPAAETAEPDSRALPLALLAVSVGSAADAGFEERLAAVRTALDAAGSPRIAPHLSGDCVLIGYAGPGQAAAAARHTHKALHKSLPLRMAGHCGLIACVRDPFTAMLRPTESGGADIVREIAGAIPPDTICVSHDFAALLAAAGGAPGDTNWIGELTAFDGGSAIGLYALRRSAD